MRQAIDLLKVSVTTTAWPACRTRRWWLSWPTRACLDGSPASNLKLRGERPARPSVEEDARRWPVRYDQPDDPAHFGGYMNANFVQTVQARRAATRSSALAKKQL
jgi:hypothetical protein